MFDKVYTFLFDKIETNVLHDI